MIRKILFTVLTIVVAALPSFAGGTHEKAAQSTLQMWVYDSLGAKNAPIYGAVDQFMKENPNIKVQLIPIPYGSSSYLNKYVVAWQAGTGPDGMMTDVAWVPQLAAMGALLNIDQKANTDIKSFFPGPVQTVTYDKHVYGLPFYVDDLGMFYNKSAFQNAGLQLPAKGWTWSDFLHDAKTLTKGSMHGFGFEGGWGGTFEWYPWFWQSGAKLLNADKTSVAFDSPQGVNATRTYLNLTTTDKVVPSAALSWKSWSELAAAFSAGTIAMFESGDWQVPLIKKDNPSFQWSLAPLPSDKISATVVGGADWVINSKTKMPDAAYKWVQYITGPAVFHLMDGYGRLAARLGNSNQTIVKSDPLMKVFVNELAYSKARPTIPQWTNIDYNCLQPAFQKVLLKGAAVTSALSEAASCGDKVLAKK